MKFDPFEFAKMLQDTGEDAEEVPHNPRKPKPPTPKTDKERLRTAAKLVEKPVELVIDQTSGRVRQAGAVLAEGQAVMDFKALAERNLYAFAKGVLKKWWLYSGLHIGMCNFLTTTKSRHRALLFPREHAKTSVVSHALPLHLLLQPQESNLYFENFDGASFRILLACETLGRAQDHLKMLAGEMENNALLRALWPHRVWPTKPPRNVKWNKEELTIPRPSEFPDPSIRAIGVDGAVTGAHPNVLIKDDLIARKAANSPAEMLNAINWHVTSRALVGAQPMHLEWIIGTRWAVQDLYAHILQNDPSVLWKIMGCYTEGGDPVYPVQGSNTSGEAVGFTRESLEAKERELGAALFSLMYKNEARDPSLADFLPGDVRSFRWVGGLLEFDDEPGDQALLAMYGEPALAQPKAKKAWWGGNVLVC